MRPHNAKIQNYSNLEKKFESQENVAFHSAFKWACDHHSPAPPHKRAKKHANVETKGRGCIKNKKGRGEQCGPFAGERDAGPQSDFKLLRGYPAGPPFAKPFLNSSLYGP